MIYLLWGDKGRNLIRERVGSKKRELMRFVFLRRLFVKGKRRVGW